MVSKPLCLRESSCWESPLSNENPNESQSTHSQHCNMTGLRGCSANCTSTYSRTSPLQHREDQYQTSPTEESQESIPKTPK